MKIIIIACLLNIIRAIPPQLPSYWTTVFVGHFIDNDVPTNCSHSGVMYYNNDIKKLRTDWTFNATQGACPGGNGYLTKTDINDGIQKVIYNYHIPSNSSEFNCNTIPLPYWWGPDYLSYGVMVGKQVITTDLGETINTIVYNNTGLFISGYVLSYIDMTSNNLVRMTIKQGPMENYYTDFVGGIYSLSPSAVNENIFQIFGNLECIPV